MPHWRGYDVVQLINPMFLELKAQRIFPVYRYLKRHNRAMVLCAMGMDYYWVSECINNKPLRYSDFNIGQELRTDETAIREQRDWLGTEKERLNKYIAADCDAIVSGLYEYDVCYRPHYKKKTHFIPFPIRSLECRVQSFEFATAQKKHAVANSTLYALNYRLKKPSSKLKLFIGISKGRNQYKGTDIMFKAAMAVREKYPDRLEIVKAEGVPFSQYQDMMENCDAIMDQLYSYTPAMNALLAMSKGIVVIGGGEPENYDILNEHELRPIVNVEPTYESVYKELEQLVLHPEHVQLLKKQSVEYIRRHHDYIKVAMRYQQLYESLVGDKSLIQDADGE
jgi:glycosyltransferase involved in cell wall biosynthesis